MRGSVAVLLAGASLLAACGGRAGVVAERADAVPPLTAAPPAPTPVPEPERETVPQPDTQPDAPEDPSSGPVRGPELGGVDELFPALGSPDVDVLAYDVRLDLTGLASADGDTTTLSGEVTIDAVVPVEVNGLALDAVGIDVVGATVDGEPTNHRREPMDLVVDLPSTRDEIVRATVEYTFEADRVRSRSELPVGWFVEGERAHVLNQPDGARTWLPSNDHPSDKATWRFEVLAPPGLTVSANGELLQSGNATDPWIWEESDPMATYLIHLLVGDLELVRDTTTTIGRGGLLDLVHVVPAGDAARFTEALTSVDPQLRYLEAVLGPYPLQRYGLAFAGLVDGLAMETQGRSLFAEEAYAGPLGVTDELVLSHELAHQWYGNAVTPATWSDIWLSESFATYAQWLWFDETGLEPIEFSAGNALADRQTPGPPTSDPTVAELFGYNVYDGGAAVLHALRLTIGDRAFFELLQRWVSEFAGTSRSTAEFEQFAADVHGGDLSEFFDEWLHAPVLPGAYPG